MDNKFKTLIEDFLIVIEKFHEVYVDPHINIVLDELDQLKSEYNISHFIKVILENLDRKGISALSFIFVGQNILFERLNVQQPAFHRLVKHFDLKPLDIENSEYVLDACLKRAQVTTDIDDEAKEFLLNMSSGYPYSIHLLGHETFNSMLERYIRVPKKGLMIIKADFASGMKNALISEEERFSKLFSSLNELEKQYITIMADESKKDIPYTYHFNDIIEGIPNNNSEEKLEQATEVLNSLCEKNILTEIGDCNMFSKQEEKQYKFNEEIFRVYLFYNLHNIDKLDYE